MAEVYELAKHWLQLDRNPITRKQIQDLVNDHNVHELNLRLASRIQFGTAGLRAQVGAGYSRMNDLTVIQATQGLVSYLLATISNHATPCSVVIGFDHRSHLGLTSARFARLIAAVFLSKNIKVYFFPNFVHTPLVPFSVTHLNASCGIMITASHNPKEDNGYKLYWSNGSQIIPPLDTDIAHSITQHLEPWIWDEELVGKHMAENSPLVVNPTAQVVEAYMASITDLAKTVTLRAPLATGVRICYTAMHGVGFPFMRRAFEVVGLPAFYLTPEQVHPDPKFPTVTFPNPEEGQGALALAMAAAQAHSCQIILANDPDADRLAVAEKLPNSRWYIFTGNQIGIMLAAFLLPGFKRRYPDAKLGCLTTTVSSMMLKKFAQVEGLAFEETLTGFKYLGNCGMAMCARGEADKIMFAFEQAIGFMCGPAVMDKDGVSAGVCIGELAQWLATHPETDHPKTLHQWLQHLYVKYGLFCSNDGYIVEHDKSKIDAMFANIRPESALAANEDWSAVISGTQPPPSYPTALDDFAITAVRDCTSGWDSTTTDHRPILPTSRSSHMITLTFSVPQRLSSNPDVALEPLTFTLRTSGTEPKVKWYSELAGVWIGDQSTPVANKLAAIQAVADAVLGDLVLKVKTQWLLA